MGLEDLTKGLDLGNLGDLAGKAGELMDNVPDDMKEQAGSVIDGLKDKLPDEADGVIDGLKDTLGF